MSDVNLICANDLLHILLFLTFTLSLSVDMNPQDFSFHSVFTFIPHLDFALHAFETHLASHSPPLSFLSLSLPSFFAKNCLIFVLEVEYLSFNSIPFYEINRFLLKTDPNFVLIFQVKEVRGLNSLIFRQNSFLALFI